MGTTRKERFEPLPEWVAPATRLIHAARRPDRNAGSVVPPIYQTSTFHYPELFSEARETGQVYLYTRMGNPTHEVTAELLRSLEGGEEARVFGSGMGAISTTVLSFVRPGDTVVALENLYGGTLELLSTLLPAWGVKVRWVSDAEAREPERCVVEGTRLALIESPSNPLLRVHDISRWAAATDRASALLLVDNTIATPINQSPLDEGADLVVHSATKYLGGHADLMAGALVGPRRLVERVDATHRALGSVLDPFAAFLLARGLRTLALRVERQNRNGEVVAAALRAHRSVAMVHYPGTASEEDEAVARRQMRGRGGLLSISLKGGAEAADRFIRSLRLAHVASSFGGVETLVSRPSETSHARLDASELSRRGIDPGMVRLSLGIEQPEDLVRDLTEALDAIERG